MLTGKIAVVTGAGQGIGKHAAKTLAEAGATIAIADIDGEKAARTAAELGAISPTMAVTLDVRDEDAVRDALATVARKAGGIDILVNNAGIVPHFRWGVPLWPRIADMPEEFWDRVVRTNLYGTFFCAKHVVAHMTARGGGHIVNLYGGGRTDPPGALTYMVTKNGIRTFSRFLAEEVRAANICVVTFSPRWAIATETAPDEAKERMPRPEILGDAFVQCATLPLDRSGTCVAYADGTLVPEEPMEG